jgi:predicted PurR-regulated permease PerM
MEIEAMVDTGRARSWHGIWPSIATVVLVILAIACLNWAKPVLVPVAFALLLSFVLSPVIAWLQRRGLGRVPAVSLVVAATAFCLTVFGWILVSQFATLAEQLPVHQERVARRISEARKQGQGSMFGKVQRSVERLMAAATEPVNEPEQTSIGTEAEPVRVIGNDSSSTLGPLAASAGEALEFLVSAGLVLMLVVLMLMNREDVRNRLLRLFGEGRVTVTTRALDDAGKRISRFLLAQLLLNSSFGLLIAVALWGIGVPYALVWGFLTAFLRYFPYVGPWVAALLPIGITVLTAEGWRQPLSVVLLFIVLELISNLLMEPWLYGQSIGVSQAALLVAVAFWTWLWGSAGLVLAVPLTVCLVVLGKYVPPLRFLDIILGDTPALTTEVKFYQRLLARDHDEAWDLIRDQLRSDPIEKVLDQTVIPALIAVRQDSDADLIRSDEAACILQAIRAIVDDHEDFRQNGDNAPCSGMLQLNVVACPARDSTDATALACFCRLLSPGFRVTQVNSIDQLVSEVMAKASDELPSIACIAALPAGEGAHTRLLCKQLRRRFPDLNIVVGRWGLRTGIERDREQVMAAGASHFGTTMTETASQLVQLAERFGALSCKQDSRNESETVQQSEFQVGVAG